MRFPLGGDRIWSPSTSLAVYPGPVAQTIIKASASTFAPTCASKFYRFLLGGQNDWRPPQEIETAFASVSFPLSEAAQASKAFIAKSECEMAGHSIVKYLNLIQAPGQPDN